MPTHIQPYPAYQPSGLAWLPQIPVHWRTLHGKWLLKKMKRPVRDTDEVVTCFRDGVVTLRKNRRTEGFTESLQEIGYQGIRAGDLVVHAMDAFAGAIGVSESDGKGTPVYSVCRSAPNADAYYYAYILREMARRQWIAALATGIRERSTDFRYATLASQRLPLPPLAEQRAIVCYLDQVDQRIQCYIKAKEKLIARLQEARQAMIQRAVMRGLEPSVPLKPSGVDWLGDVPAHWEVRRLRTVAEMRVSNVDKHVQDGELPVRLCNYVDVYKNDCITEDIAFMQATATAAEIERFRLEGGDILVTKDSETWNDIGVPALVEHTAEDLVCGYHLALLRPAKSSLDGAYLLRALQSPTVGYQFHVSANGVTRYGLKHEAIKSVQLPLPPLSEQRAIAAHLDQATAAIDTAIDNARRQAERMAEYRASLIAHVVTGKLDVRAAAERTGTESS